MRIIFLSAYILLCTSLFSQTIKSFASSADVLVYLNNKSNFTNKNNGVTLTFFDMGGRVKSNKGVSYYNPDVTLINQNRAVIQYESLTSSGYAKMIVDCKLNIVMDRYDNTIYSAESFDNEPLPGIYPYAKSKPTVSASIKIIGKSIRIGNIVVAQYDFPNSMIWKDADEACYELGGGWRLPSKEELNTLYVNKKKIGGFTNNLYWSSTNIDDYNTWFQYFGSGKAELTNGKYYKGSVRAVRSF